MSSSTSGSCDGTWLSPWWVYFAAAGGSWCAGLLATVLLRSADWLCCERASASDREREKQQRKLREAHSHSTLFEVDACFQDAGELDDERRQARSCDAWLKNALVRLEQLAEKLRSGETLVGRLYNLAGVVLTRLSHAISLT